MMGAGKSTVGPELATRLGRPFADSDAEIERQAGASVSRIFEREGEAAFRQRERRVIEQLAEGRGVVALGGGAIAQPGARERLRERGVVVYLRASPRALLARISDASDRPLLAGLAPAQREERLGSLLEERRSAYEAADLVVETEGRSPGEIAAQIATWLAGREAG
jgi:shikimate kinase